MALTQEVVISPRLILTLVPSPAQWSHVLQDIAYDDSSSSSDGSTVTATFTNGASLTGTLVVGADGPHSAVRKHMFGPEAETRPIGLTIVNVHFRYPDADKARVVRGIVPVTSMAVSPACMVLVSMQDAGEDPSDPALWQFQLIMVWKGSHDARASNEERHAEVRRRAAGLAEVGAPVPLWGFFMSSKGCMFRRRLTG